MAREVAITGMGLVTPLGKTVAENWQNFKAGRTGIGCYPDLKHPRQFHHLGKVTDLGIPPDLPAGLRKEVKYLNRSSQLGIMAAMEAVSQAGVDLSGIPPQRRGLFVASGDHTKVGYDFFNPAIRAATYGGSGRIDWERLNRTALEEVNPFFLLESMHNNAFSFLSALFDLRGPNACLASLSPCGLQAVELACRAIRQRQAEVALVVACSNWVTEAALHELYQLGMLSEGRFGVNSMRPFDRYRDGLIPGEGGAALLLQNLAAARERGAVIQGLIQGSGTGKDSRYRTDALFPSAGQQEASRQALQPSGSSFKDLAFIILHGNGTILGDLSELNSLAAGLGKEVREVPLCGIKGATAHLGAASDLTEPILGLAALRESLVPGTLNFESSERPLDAFKLSPHLRQSRKARFMAGSRGLSGETALVVIGLKQGDCERPKLHRSVPRTECGRPGSWPSGQPSSPP